MPAADPLAGSVAADPLAPIQGAAPFSGGQGGDPFAGGHGEDPNAWLGQPQQHDGGSQHGGYQAAYAYDSQGQQPQQHWALLCQWRHAQ